MGFGAKAFRLGKQSCIYSYEGGDPQKLETLLSGLAALAPTVLHIDNANPMMIDERRTELFVKYLTPGSTAAMGIESFDPEVTKANNLNCPYDMAFETIRTRQPPRRLSRRKRLSRPAAGDQHPARPGRRDPGDPGQELRGPQTHL